MAKKEIPEDEGPSQEWLASYADAMTLLLAFFIMMFAFALIDEGKFFDFKVGVQAALGIPDPLTDNTESILSDGTGNFPEIGFTPVTPTEEGEEATEELRQALEESGLVTPENADELVELLRREFDRLGAGEFVDVGVDERGVFIRFDGRVLFASGSAQIDPGGLSLLGVAADVLEVVDNLIEIEGHTDNQPTAGDWPSNWELSAARASVVVRWFIEFGAIPDAQLVAVGRADTRPRADNATEEGRQENRRVEIVIRVNGIAGEAAAEGAEPVDVIGDPTGVEIDPLDGATGIDDGSDPAAGDDGTETPVDIDDPTAATEPVVEADQPVDIDDPAFGDEPVVVDADPAGGIDPAFGDP